MFVTLQDFFENYRIKNGQFPNETVMNRGTMRLKRETRELKAILDLLTGQELPSWENTPRSYEIDEYIRWDGVNYKSRTNFNEGNEPFPDDETYWEIVSITAAGGGGSFSYNTFTAQENQTVFTTDFQLNSTPMVFQDGVLLEDTMYSKTNSQELTLNTPTQEGDTIVITSGVAIATDSIIPSQTFISNTNQTVFECDFDLYNPSVFVEGSLQRPEEYSFDGKLLTFNEPITENSYIVISNSGLIGPELKENFLPRNTSQTLNINIEQDTDVILTTNQNTYGSLVITDTGELLTADRDVIINDFEKNSFVVSNKTNFDLTVRPANGNGVKIAPGSTLNLKYYNGNVMYSDITNNLLYEKKLTTDVTEIELTDLDLNLDTSYRIEVEFLNASMNPIDISCYINNDTLDSNYVRQFLQVDGANISSGRENNTKIVSLGAEDRSLSVMQVNLTADNYFKANISNNEGTELPKICNIALNRLTTILNVTDIKFVASEANALDRKSVVRVYRGK